jgi:hypothetical protein
MKTTRLFILLIVALCIGFFAARWSEAQTANNTSAKKLTTSDDVDIQELESLENYLNDTHQTNALKQLNDILSDNRAWDRAADMSVTVGILRGLRNGKTDEVLNFLENHLDSNISVFASEYRTLPISFQKQMNLKSLQAAYDYRTKFPFKSSNEYAENVTNAFKILSGNSTK